MTLWIIIAPCYDEPDHDQGAAARTLAAESADGPGARVRVISSRGSSQLPERECIGLVEVHRIDSPEGGGHAGFAARAAALAHVLAPAGGDVRVVCVDAPWCLVALAATARWLGRARPALIAFHTAAGDGVLTEVENRFADECWGLSLVVQRRGAPSRVVRLPARMSAVHQPALRGPGFIVPALHPPERRAAITELFRRSAGDLPGWTLACAKGAGRWIMLGEAHAGGPRDAVFIAPALGARQDPAACRIALLAGQACLMSDASPLAEIVPEALRPMMVFREDDWDDLRARMVEMARASRGERSAWARAVGQAMRAGAVSMMDAADEAAARVASSTEPERGNRLEGWRALERALTARPAHGASMEAAA